jgi:hypothetical protein
MKEIVLVFSEEELKDKRLIKPLHDLVLLKLSLQKGEFISISQVELEVIKNIGLVPKEKYEEVKYKGEVGKFRGKRVVLIKPKGDKK